MGGDRGFHLVLAATAIVDQFLGFDDGLHVVMSQENELHVTFDQKPLDLAVSCAHHVWVLMEIENRIEGWQQRVGEDQSLGRKLEKAHLRH